MAQFNDLAWLDATAQAELVSKREVTPVELVEAAIARIERLNPKLNAVVTPMFDLAREAAAGELPDGPFRGVPFLLKDLMAAYAGVKMTLGSKLLQNFVPDYLLALQTVQWVSRQFARFFRDYDVLLTPTLAEPPVALGTFDSPEDDPLRGFHRAEGFVPFTPICNMSGQPAMSVPLYWNSAGLPVGSHFIGRFGDEATLFRFAAQLEQAQPWAQRRPPVAA